MKNRIHKHRKWRRNKYILKLYSTPNIQAKHMFYGF